MKMRQAPGFKAITRFDKQLIKVAGYFVPLEQNDIGQVTELLFVPYYGACIHVPPPPANQIIYASINQRSAELSMFDPYWLEGTLLAQAHESDLAHAAYRMENAVLIPWE